jgi:glycerol-3-phosphate dehydrogenase (NAD(P)+)
MNITVLGAGSWGTALALLLADKGCSLRLWARKKELVDLLNSQHENKQYLPGYPLPEKISATDDIASAVSGSEIIVFAVPSEGIRQVAAMLAGNLPDSALIVNAGKGLESSTGLRLSQVLCQELGEGICDRLVALSGPNLGVELAKQIPTATVVASKNEESAATVQEIFTTPHFRVYRNPDFIGVELGGALKNVFAIGAGISDGLGFGDNTKSVLVTRGLAEMVRFGNALGASPLTFMGLAGIGDLITTSASKLSRNLRLGRAVGEGKSIKEALEIVKQVAEGMPTCRAAYNLSQQLNVYMPITEQVYKVLFENKDPDQAVCDLMLREPKEEYS